MTTDNKTLADVQPGGRVRLGDKAELDRLEFQAWARELLPCPFCGNSAEFVPYKDNGLTLKCKSMGCIQRNQRTLRYGIDWLRTSMAEHWNTRALSAQPSPGGQDGLVQEALEYFERAGNAGDRQYVAAIRAALAARQPVGEPIGWYTDDHLTDRSATTYDRTVAERWRAKGWPVSPLYAAPPAQAVDLGQFRQVVIEARCSYERERWLSDVAECDRLLALIDSQAVGK